MPLEVSKQLIENILLCDPITFRGKLKLKELGLFDDFTASDFFNIPDESRLWVPPIDLEKHHAIELTPSDLAIRVAENYSHERIAKRRDAFYQCFEGKQGKPVTVIKGVVGSGKSIELHRQIINRFGKPPFQSFGSSHPSPNAILIDLEEDVQSVFSERTYVNPKREEPIWLFCTAALDTLINYIEFLADKHNNELCNAYDNLTRYFYSTSDFRVRTATRFESELIKEISSWAKTLDPDKWETIRQKIIDKLQSAPKEDASKRVTSTQAGKEDIILILWLLFLISFCSNPAEEKMILIDNMEDYIAIRTPDEELKKPLHEGHLVSEEEIKEIYDCLDQTKNKIDRALMVYKKNKNPKFEASISIVLAARRTTYSLLSKWFVGKPADHTKGVFDITGDISIESLWRKKYSTIWKKYLQPRCLEEKNNDVINYIEFANKVIVEGEDAVGISYTQKLMPMLSRGLRRTGHNLSINLYHVFNDLTDKETAWRHITIEQFYSILNERYAARYMLRQGLIEYYYMDQFSRTIEEDDMIGRRWRLLNVGHITSQRDGYLYGIDGKKTSKTFKFNPVRYDDGAHDEEAARPVDDLTTVSTHRSLSWRLLGALSNCHTIRTSECIAPEYIEQSIGVLLRNLIPKRNKRAFANIAKVIVAMNMPEREGDYSPYALLQMQYVTTSKLLSVDSDFADMLELLWERAGTGSAKFQNKEGNLSDNQIRITEGGCDFIFQWQASFSFFSALYCYNFSPLFFVNSKEVIAHILHSVYNNAKIQRDWYRKEARSFCSQKTKNMWRKMPSDYLLKIEEDKYTSFELQVRNLHCTYLKLYETYIQQCYLKMGITEEDKEDIIRMIQDFEKLYVQEWRGEVICF